MICAPDTDTTRPTLIEDPVATTGLASSGMRLTSIGVGGARYDPVGGEHERGGRPDPGLAFEPEGAAMEFHERFGDRQTEARALVFAIQPAVDLGEGLQDAGHVLRGDPDSGVPDTRSEEHPSALQSLIRITYAV